MSPSWALLHLPSPRSLRTTCTRVAGSLLEPGPSKTSPISLLPERTPPGSDSHCAHLGPAEKGIKARGDLPLLFSESKRKGL